MQVWAIWKLEIYLTSRSQTQFYTRLQGRDIITAYGGNTGKLHSLSLVIQLAEHLTKDWQTAKIATKNENGNRMAGQENDLRNRTEKVALRA